MDEYILTFLSTHHQPESIRQVIDLTSALFANTIQIALKDPVLVSTIFLESIITSIVDIIRGPIFTIS